MPSKEEEKQEFKTEFQKIEVSSTKEEYKG